MKNPNALWLLCGGLMLTPLSTLAVTIYKVTDTNGKVTYQNHPPFKGIERVQTIEGVGRVETMEIDPEQNIVPARTQRSSLEPTLGRSQPEDAAAITAIDELAKRNYAAGVAAAIEDAANNGINNGGTGIEIEGTGTLPAPPVIDPVVPRLGAPPLPDPGTLPPGNGTVPIR